MQKVMFVLNGKLDEVQKELDDGWMVKSVHTVSNQVSCSSGGEDNCSAEIKGDVCAYIVLEKG